MNLIEAGGYIINLDQIAVIRKDGKKVVITFAASGSTVPMTVTLHDKDGERFLQLLRSGQTVVS
ncbi:MAG TPA: hypothetical protein VNZ64_21475 [Candidatus Acidoferrum sp.]|jgi:hypothetical protein|nr:hypothetical protein [Candidatus Acidoferrum sp.]